MGNLYSSLSEEARQFKELAEEEGVTPVQQIPATPAPTGDENNAKHQLVLGLIDPRSPSQGVNRTPLEVEERNRRIEKTRITNFLNKENNLPGGVDAVKTPTGPPKDCLAAFDPRSPNPEINRTPISYANPPVGRKVFQSSDH